MGHKLRRKAFRAQSAMEYLMTYGWAILIIAIVMVALFALGIFNSTNFAPKATAGACQVVRNVESVTLQGQCQGELPMYVALLNGQNSVITPPSLFASSGVCNLTITGWSYDAGMPSTGQMAGVIGLSSNGWADIEYRDDVLRFELRNLSAGNSWTVYGNYKNTWVFTALVLTNGVATGGYINNNFYPSGHYIGCIGLTNSKIGSWDRAFNGYLSNIQVYNTSLSSNDLNSLYRAGIGGAPIDPLHIVGWWPLNGNTNDYSGNGHTSTQAAVSYTSSWTYGYNYP